MIEECNKCSKKSYFVQKEKKSEFRIKNLSKVDINEVKVDGCLVIGHKRRCDWLYEITCRQITKIYYVELKGKNLQYALEQILETINLCEHQYKHNNYKRIACVVLSTYPQENSAIQNKKRELKRKNIELKTSTLKLEITV